MSTIPTASSFAPIFHLANFTLMIWLTNPALTIDRLIPTFLSVIMSVEHLFHALKYDSITPVMFVSKAAQLNSSFKEIQTLSPGNRLDMPECASATCFQQRPRQLTDKLQIVVFFDFS